MQFPKNHMVLRASHGTGIRLEFCFLDNRYQD